MARTVAIVPHTHWDREWYSPFQTFRLRLVQVLDELLAHLDADPSYRHFMLDGQLAVVDDYLEVRPAAADAIRRLVGAGRLSVGPWYTLPDEFLVSGETLVRNLQLGLERAAAFGGAMAVGYLPDMFGHVAQMPQLLRLFGFDHAVVWRGVPAAVDRDAFWWAAPDGSTVRAEYLLEGYGNGAPVPDDAKALLTRVADYEAEHESELTGPLLWMDGTDHLAPQTWLGRVVAEANGLQDDYDLVVTSLVEYLDAAATATSDDDLPSWSGELRSGARANLLMGVASNRVDIKQAAAACERTLEREAEPLCALFLPPDAWPAELLAVAWREVVRNAAHDSICACSHDEVGVTVRHRYAEATRIGEGLAAWAMASLGASVEAAPGHPVVVNPSARTRAGLVEVILPGEGPPPPGTQLLRIRPPTLALELDDAALAATVALQMEHERRYEGVRIERADGSGVLAEAERAPDGQLVSPSLRTALRALAEAPPPGPVRLVARQVPGRKVLVRAEEVPGFGWRTLSFDGAVPDGVDIPQPVVAGDDGGALDNGLVTLTVDLADASFALDGDGPYGLLVDGGDVGDTYNWCPPPGDVEVAGPDRPAGSEVVEAGPLRGRIRLTAPHTWRGVAVEVTTTLELRAGERFVRVTTAFDNRARDHRLRALFRLPEPADRSTAECAFAVVERGLAAEGGPSELGVPTFPSRRFVRAGGLTIAHEGLLEYELVDVEPVAGGRRRAHALALTLVRATGVVSRGPMATRPVPAGPALPATDAQLQQPVVVRYAVSTGDVVDPYALAEDAFVSLRVTAADGGTGRPATGSALAVRGATVSAVRRTDGGALEVRVFNPSATPAHVELAGRHGWLVDLRGHPLEPFEGGFGLGPWQIATVQLAEPAVRRPSG